MFNWDGSARERPKRVEVDDVVDSLLDAIETLPERKDNRSDPIFEPHFRLVSIIHKLVRKGLLEVRDLLLAFQRSLIIYIAR
jgi:hypothetical protein